jgi:lipopolysaccharide biosynthesis protein
MKPVALFFHNYYGDHESWIRFFCEKMETPFYLFYHVVGDSLYNLQEPPPTANLKELVVRRSPNRGKDIGGKLVLLDAYMRLGMDCDYMVFLHDKKSPYAIQNQEWKDKLFGILEPPFVAKTLACFAADERTGIVTGSVSIRDEYDYIAETFLSRNAPLLKELQQTYGIIPARYLYAAGTMFWARALPLLGFFRRYAPLDIRDTLETGNVLDHEQGTRTHSWERLLSWLIIAQGYDIKGL